MGVGFSPSAKMPLIVSAGWDKLVKVWNLSNCKLRTNLVGHTGVVYSTSISPDGSLCASGGKDGTAMLWDVNDGKHLYSLDAGNTIMHWSSAPRTIGSQQPRTPPSRFGTLRTRMSLKSSWPRTLLRAASHGVFP